MIISIFSFFLDLFIFGGIGFVIGAVFGWRWHRKIIIARQRAVYK